MRPTVQAVSAGALRRATASSIEARQGVRRTVASSSRMAMVPMTAKRVQSCANVRFIASSAAMKAESTATPETPSETETAPSAEAATAYPFASNVVIRQRPAVNEFAQQISYAKGTKDGALGKRIARKGILAAVNGELRAQYDKDGALKAMFKRGSKQILTPGSIVNVETWNDMTKTTFNSFAGVVLAIRRRGTSTSILVRNLVNHTGVEVRYNIYSPVIKQIHVIQRAVASKHEKGLRRMRRAKLYYMRYNDKKLPNVARAIAQERKGEEEQQQERDGRNEEAAKDVLRAGRKGKLATSTRR